jgi:hypothetical protein
VTETEWYVYFDEVASQWSVWQREEDGTETLISARGITEENARRIAAAPDLLAALKSMVNYYAPKHSEWWHGPHQVSITKAAKAAINKAGGAK